MQPSPSNHGSLIKLTAKAVKYYLLGIFGLTLVCLVSCILGIPQIAEQLLTWFGGLLWRLAILIGCLVATAIVKESLR